MENIGAISYATGSGVFLILSLVLMTGQRGRPHKFALMLASLASALWMGVTAWVLWFKLPLLIPYLFEPLRDFGLLAFLALVLSSAYSRHKQARRAFRRTLSVLGSFTFLLIMMVIYQALSGKGIPMIGRIDLLLAGYLVMAVVGLAMIEQLIRNARPQSRRVVKYLSIGLGALFAYDFYLYSYALLFSGIDMAAWNARGFINAIVVPVIGISVARDPQWSLDIFVSRRVIFHTTALLGSGIYLLFMGLGGYFIKEYGGNWGLVAQAIFLFGAILVLAVLLFSGQLRAILRVYINKHFFHYKFEYREEWLRFIDTVTSEEPGEQVRARTVQAIADILMCPAGSMWLYRGHGRYEPVASWQLDDADPTWVFERSEPVAQYLQKMEWVINLDEYQDSPHTYDDLMLPDWLHKIPDAWLITPLMFHSKLLGMVVLTRPKVVHALNWEDFDLLRTVGRQSAAHLAQLDAAQLLTQARQFEACNRLSSYVMHDLKNLIAQLSLVVSNAARHKHNPQFMEDAIQTVENSVNKMNRLLGQLRAGNDPEQPKDRLELCSLLTESVEAMSAGQPQPSLDCQATNVLIRGNHDRFDAVVGHVIRNAQDATADDGMIIVRLFRVGGDAVVEVQDTGKGMDQDFIRTRLFKPFDSTKGGSGMGIGVYETREYVRSLGGEVEVISRVGEGSTFRLRIPISDND